MRSLCAAAILIILGTGCSQPEAPGTIPHEAGAGPRNVVFVLVDTLRTDRLYGERNGVPLMPYSASLAEAGLQFTRAVSPSSWTKTSMASLFTSTYVDTHQVKHSAQGEDIQNPTSDVLAPSWETIAEYFKKHGYATHGIQTNANVSEHVGFGQGFDSYQFLSGYPAGMITDAALGVLDQLPEEEPFFLFLQYFDPHTPYTPPAEYIAELGPEPELTGSDLLYTGTEFMTYFRATVNHALKLQGAPPPPDISDAARETILHRYDAECLYTDDELKRLLTPIFRKHPDTVLVFVSDHGEELWEHGGLGHGTNLFDEQIRVPYFFYGAGIEARKVESPVNTIDTLPTLAEILGLPANTQWQGASLLPADRAPAPVFTRTYGSWPMEDVDAEAVIDWPWKFVRDHSTTPSHERAMLFSLERDPREQDNLLDTEQERVNRYGALLDEHTRITTAAAPDGPAPTAELDAAQREELEALGYLGGVESGGEEPLPGPGASAAPDVVLIVIDTLRADRILAERNGTPVMPHLRAFAKQAWNFTEATAQASWTKPSVASILTGLYTETHKVRFGVQAQWVETQETVVEIVPDEVPVASEYFARHGYGAAGVQTNQHLQEKYGFGRGCAAYAQMPWAEATAVTSAAIENAQKLAQPMFLYVHYYDPHATYSPPEPHRSAFGPLPEITEQDERLLTQQEYQGGYYLDLILNEFGLKQKRDYPEFSNNGREYIRQMYDGECHYVDEQLHRLITWLEEHRPGAIIAITSDHGEEFWEHGSIGHSKTLYQELTHVPLIIRLPGEEARVIETPVETIDILPTIAAAAEIPPHDFWQGRNLRDPAQLHKERPVFSQTSASIPEAGLCLEAVRVGAEKLIVDRVSGKAQLFDLAEDRSEQRNLQAEQPARVEELTRMLAQHRRDAAAHPAAAFGPVVVPLDEQTRQELEAMGYLGAGAEGPGADRTPCPVE